jgi:hypothetical protein
MREDTRYLVIDIETNSIDFDRGTEIDQAHTVWCVGTYDIQTKKYVDYGNISDTADWMGRRSLRPYDDEFLRVLRDPRA